MFNHCWQPPFPSGHSVCERIWIRGRERDREEKTRFILLTFLCVVQCWWSDVCVCAVWEKQKSCMNVCHLCICLWSVLSILMLTDSFWVWKVSVSLRLSFFKVNSSTFLCFLSFTEGHSPLSSNLLKHFILLFNPAGYIVIGKCNSRSRYACFTLKRDYVTFERRENTSFLLRPLHTRGVFLCHQFAWPYIFFELLFREY